MASAKILIVEDEAIVAADLMAKLKQFGYDVIGPASRGEQAIDLANTQRPNLVLMDISLGGDMDGIKAADRIRQECPTPIVFLTAHSDSETLTRAKVTAPFGYLLKPFNERELQTHIEMALYRHQIEETLRENEGRLRLAIDATHVGLCDWDIVNERATWAGHCGDLFGLRPDAFKGTFDDLLALVHKDDRETVNTAMRRALDEQAPYACEFRIVRPDQSIRWLEWWGEVYRDEQNRPHRMVGLLQDITRRRQAEEELRRMADELERRVADRTKDLVRSEGRLRALSKELNLIEQRERRKLATDLHDYLAQMLVLGRIKLDQAKQGPLSPSSAGFIAEAESVINQALAYTRSLVGQLCPPVLKEFGLVVALKWLSEQMQQHRLDVVMHAKDDRLPLADDQEVLLFQSVRELLMNAVKHAKTESATISLSCSDGELRLVVRDNGIGFDVTTAPLSAQFGLFSIKERMQALGGRFVLLSEPGQGTTATLVLPLSNGASESPSFKETTKNVSLLKRQGAVGDETIRSDSQGTHHSSPITDHPVGSIRVLLVDDHVMIRKGLKAILLDYPGFDIVGEAANGAEAVSLTRSLQPEVVIMDISMPVMDGIEATRSIKRDWPGVIIIGLTVHSAAQVKTAMKEAGASTVLTKEAAVDELPRTIQASCATRKSTNGASIGTMTDQLQ